MLYDCVGRRMNRLESDLISVTLAESNTIANLFVCMVVITVS